ncbi:MAG: 6,7-dimethyl-8-ribityllumazine synthase [Myxococcales bacterium]|nr:6,7-dimethyl-8-ribityllumazine synthase [Myxococcales bacterium]MCZ6714334.1 6,7-dimethyl-8-ribityllumazine synthase [Deltaproteobacteria bacterium]TDJ02064.1 MAG: 6,7-dimethyl-8-ribityllumazine synthase [Deltaproteobacteria bacterium]TDJ09687.1 MAG: 6,7-dimethyl-8-ribityllumazine synthase [Deltaproteobacteria bacterium]
MGTIEAKPQGRGLRVAVVVSRFNHLVSHRLLDGCLARLRELGCEDVDVLWVPGAFELPLATQAAAETGRYDALVAVGAVIRGETSHFDYVCRGVTDGLQQVSLRSGSPVAFGVLTTDTEEQALERAAVPGEPGKNKGAEAAEVALEMASLLATLRRGK